MTNELNPFEEQGFHPGIMDLTVQALKRGHNGDGYPVEVTLEDDSSVVLLDVGDREIVASLVDHAVGEESARTVGHGVIGILKSKLD
jgi:hypothetical protein